MWLTHWLRRLLSPEGPRPRPGRALRLERFEERTLLTAAMPPGVLVLLMSEDAGGNHLLRIDPQSGAQKVIPLPRKYSGDLAVSADGAAYLIDRAVDGMSGFLDADPELSRVDLVTGAVTEVPGGPLGHFLIPSDMAVTAEGKILITYTQTDANWTTANTTHGLMWVDPTTGDRTTVPFGSDIREITAPAKDGSVYLIRYTRDPESTHFDNTVLRLDPATGISSPITSGSDLHDYEILEMEVAKDGTILLTAISERGIGLDTRPTLLRVNPGGGAISATVTGPAYEWPYDPITPGPSGSLYVTRTRSTGPGRYVTEVDRLEAATGGLTRVAAGRAFVHAHVSDMATIPAGILLSKPVTVANGDVKFTYRVTIPVVRVATNIGAYWATGDEKTPDFAHRLSKFTVKAGTRFGKTGRLKVTAAQLRTAPPGATALVIASDPEHMKLPDGRDNPDWAGDRLDIRFSKKPLTADDLMAIMPGLSKADAERYADPLNLAMDVYGITTPEQRAMFLGQVAKETYNLARLSEWHNGPDADAYFVGRYWISRGVWNGLGRSVPTAQGLTLNVPHAAAGATKTYALYWDGGASRQLVGEFDFTYDRRARQYTYAFAGADPATLPPLTSHLLVVDLDTSQTVLSINNILGNWRPRDASDFRGRGGLHLTGRYNYQRYASSDGAPSDLMTNPPNFPTARTARSWGCWRAGGTGSTGGAT